jgi:HEXXH motif-containing protein
MPVDPSGLTPFHRVPAHCLDELSGGLGGPDTIRLLLAGEHSRRRVLLRHVLKMCAVDPLAFGELPSVDAAWRDLTAVEQASAASVADVLLHPPVGVWLATAVRDLLADGTAGSRWTKVGYLHSVIFAAAVRAGTTLRTSVPVRDGLAILPTLGAAHFAGRRGWAVAEALTTPGRTVLRLDGANVSLPLDLTEDTPDWWSLRQMTATEEGRTLSVWLDDIDPYRNVSDSVPPARLDADTVEAWAEALDGAWRQLCVQWPAYADSMSVGLRSISPLPSVPRRDATHSASSGDAFGAALISPPTHSTALAAALVHEFQHIKLGGLLHLAPLHDETDVSDHLYAPWRDDPRPLSGLFQGVYAFMGVAEFWCRRATATSGQQHIIAEFEFAYARRQTREALRTLWSSPGLTGLGRRFVHGMRGWMQRLRMVEVSPEPERAAWAAAADHRAVWRLRNLQPAERWVAAAAEAWLRGMPPPPAIGDVIDPVPADKLWHYVRPVLYRTRIVAPEKFARWVAEPDELFRRVSDASAADVALVDGRPSAAAAGYLSLIADRPDDFTAWAGLGLALTATGRPRSLLLRKPHVVHAVYCKLAEVDTPPDPVRLADWLGAAALRS